MPKNEIERRAAQHAWVHSYNRQDEMQIELTSLKNKIYISNERHSLNPYIIIGTPGKILSLPEARKIKSL